MAGITNPGDFMNAAKLARLESGLNAMAKKVLEAIPIQEPWSKDQITLEMRRTGSGCAQNVIEGCLATIVDKGLAKEPRRGFFIRVTAKTVDADEPIDASADGLPANQEIMPALRRVDPPQPVAPEDTGKPDTLGRLANLAVLLRRAADELEAIAMDVEERVAEVGRDGEKLRRLQMLLKDIGVGA